MILLALVLGFALIVGIGVFVGVRVFRVVRRRNAADSSAPERSELFPALVAMGVGAACAGLLAWQFLLNK